MKRTELSDYWKLLRAFLWFEAQIARQYRWAVVVQAVQFLVLLLIFARLPLEGGGESYVQFVLTGFVYQIIYESMVNGPGNRLSELQYTGQLQLVLSAPFPRWAILLATGAGSAFYGLVRAAVVLTGGLLLFTVKLEIVSWSALLASVLYTMALAWVFALSTIASSLLWPRVNVTSFFSSLLLGLLSGVFIPVDKLPEILKPLAAINPLRWGLDVFRYALGQHAAVPLEQWGLALLALFAMTAAAALLFRRADGVLVRDNRYGYF